MHVPTVRESLFRSSRLFLVGLAVWMTAIVGSAQTKPPSFQLVKPSISEAWAANLPASEKETLAHVPANFYHFGAAAVGETSNTQRFTLEFAETTKLTTLKSTPDFKIEPESSCVQGRTYSASTRCEIVVHFTPQGPGHRLGRLTVGGDRGGVTTFVGLGGYGYAPAVSFIPSVISTVPATAGSGGTGLISGAANLANPEDVLLIADTGNGKVLSIDSSGTSLTLASGYTGMSGIAQDTFGQIYFDVPSTGKMYEIYDYGPVVQASGTGSAACPVSAPCTLSSEALGTPGEMSMDPYNHLFFVDSHQGAAFSTVQPIPANLIFLYDPFPYQQSPSAAMAVDSGDNLYTLWGNGGVCEIVQQSLYNAENSNVNFTKIAGGHTCGFAGDGGSATAAEIGNKVGQIAFDLAGNLYFSDTANQRVRRVDYTTGVIRTIAGNGTSGYTGDGGWATHATLANPTGVTVDSQGQVYILSNAPAAGPTQVVRKVSNLGRLTLNSAKLGTSSPPLQVLVSNTGNSSLTLTNTVMNGTNPGDFQVDPGTTTCLLTAGATLASGQSCQIGFIFTPEATGSRSAYFNLLDNSIQGINQIFLSGSGLAASSAVKFTAPGGGAMLVANTAVPVTVSITSTSKIAPTGTVTFKVDGVAAGSAAVKSGAASFSLNLGAGAHTIYAAYSGDKNTASAHASESVTARSAATNN